jgi:methylated-DNA-protein-cysteine methyltransferase related protein
MYQFKLWIYETLDLCNCMSVPSPFTQKVIHVVSAVPKGAVVSYGQIAAYIGVPRGARQVGWTLRSLEETVDIPWWRVINNAGRISIEGNWHNDKLTQKKLLEADGIEVSDDYILDIEQYRFKASPEQLKQWGLGEEYREKVLVKYGL